MSRKTTTSEKKLNLKKETLKRLQTTLTPDELDRIAGGQGCPQSTSRPTGP